MPNNMVFQNTMPHYVFENIMVKQGKAVSHYANQKIMVAIVFLKR